LVRVESQTQKERLVKSGFKKPIVVAPISFDLNKFKPPKKRKVKNTVLFVGRLSPEKNIEMILHAADVLYETKFIIIGDGEPSYVESLHEQGGDNV
jgi:glycosyltransferase involved in cell wall biosynthesis